MHSLRSTPTDRNFSLIVHSHLRWDFVWQRPQQLLSRLARTHAVLYVEEPVFIDDIATAKLDVSVPCDGVRRVVPQMPSAMRACYDDAARVTRSLLQELVGERGALSGVFAEPVQWFYTPMPAPIMLGAFNEIGVIYDCMDELSMFRFAPAGLGQREQLLMSHANIVFTGGRHLYETKRKHHDNVHFFGCGVDVEHFARAMSDDTPVAAALRFLPKPVLGYFGVIDERLDYRLIARLAARFDHGSLVFVGPTAKVDPSELPNQNNIHWLGQQPYAQLPELVKGFDVCLMPFALNDATQFINPTKTLEYMAAGKPIVSTAVPDVVTNFCPIVHVAYTTAGFFDAVDLSLAADPARIAAGIARAKGATWDSTVKTMERLILESVAVAPAKASETRSAPRTERVATGSSLAPSGVRGTGEVNVA